MYAFLCDANYRDIKDDDPLEGAEEFRVCLKTGQATASQGVTILKINNFKFYKSRTGEKTLVQEAIDAGAAMPRSVLDCPGGNEHCSFRTQLRDVFYYEDGQVEGIGSVALQYGTSFRRLRGRKTQEFAGLVSVNMFFDIEDGLNKPKIKQQRDNFNEFWNDQPDHIQGLFVGAILLAVILCCCICGGMILWHRCCADLGPSWMRREPRVEDEIHVMPPVGVDGKATDDGNDASETYSLDDEDVVPEGDEVEESSEEEDSSSEEDSTRYDPPSSYNSRMREESSIPSSYRSAETSRPDIPTENALVAYDESKNGRSSRR